MPTLFKSIMARVAPRFIGFGQHDVQVRWVWWCVVVCGWVVLCGWVWVCEGVGGNNFTCEDARFRRCYRIISLSLTLSIPPLFRIPHPSLSSCSPSPPALAFLSLCLLDRLQEFLVFLLDGIHEGLNLVREKRYV